MLKLDYAAVTCLHICDVPLAVLRSLNDFLPLGWKLVLPSPVPFGFWLPPVIAMTNSTMRPMPYSAFSALWHHRGSAPRTLADKARLRFTAQTFNECKFHDDTPSSTADVPSLAVSSMWIFQECRWGGGWSTACAFFRPVVSGVLASWPIEATISSN
jgi:hypothetical protein